MPTAPEELWLNQREFAVEYRHLRSFAVLAEELHFGRAAARLNIAQPALSQHIKVLEEALGVPLFTRDKRHVALTFEGEQLAEEARSAISHYEKFCDSARSLRQGFRGRIRLGYVGSSILDPAMTLLINGYRARQPETEIIIEEHNVTRQLAQLVSDHLDIGLVRSPVPHSPELEYLDIATRPLIAVLPQGHPLAGQSGVALSALAEMPFLIQDDPPGTGLGWSALSACERAGFVPQPIQYTRDVAVATGLVAIGMGAALVPETQRAMLMSDVGYSTLQDAQATTTLTLCWKRHARNGALKGFVRYVKELIATSETPFSD